jgi:hypothetical protein
MIMPYIASGAWDDRHKMNSFISRGLFPSMAYECEDAFAERARTQRPFILDRVVFEDRNAAFRAEGPVQFGRIASPAMRISASPYWWVPIRKSMLEFVGRPEDERPPGRFDAGVNVPPSKPVITYISRQGWGRRKMNIEAHDALVHLLNDLGEKHGWEVSGLKGPEQRAAPYAAGQR